MCNIRGNKYIIFMWNHEDWNNPVKIVTQRKLSIQTHISVLSLKNEGKIHFQLQENECIDQQYKEHSRKFLKITQKDTGMTCIYLLFLFAISLLFFCKTWNPIGYLKMMFYNACRHNEQLHHGRPICLLEFHDMNTNSGMKKVDIL